MATAEPFGFNVLLMGPTGTGKTHAIGTLVDLGLNVRYFAFEKGAETLRGYWRDCGLAIPDNLAFFNVRAANASWGEMADNVRAVNTLSFELLKKSIDPNRGKYDQYEKFLRTFSKPVDEKGREYPPVDAWTSKDALVADGLTGMGVAAMKACVGGKFDKDQKDWGLAQNMLEDTIRRLCDDCHCHFVLQAHVEREPDPLGGTAKITVSTLGNKLAPKIPPMFSDVVLCKRAAAEWWWDTADPTADLKFRNLPCASKIKPNFAQIFEKWKNRVKEEV